MIKVSVGDFRIGEEEKKAINDVLDSGKISEGAKVREFEKEFAEFIGTKYSIVMSSGTSALIASLTALKYSEKFKLKEKQKIITTPLTYVATTNAIINSGFEPVFVDVDKRTFGITPENIKSELESANDLEEYALILPVHLMGYPCDMDKINSIAKKFELLVLEDSAQAHGSLYNGKKTGSLSLGGAFSFYIAHNIQAGEMGAVTTNELELAKLLRKIKANGRLCDCIVCTRREGNCPRMNNESEEDIDPRFTHDLIGFNFKAMDFQAALGLVQLRKAEWIIKKRQENVKYLNDSLEQFSEILQLPLYSKDISYLAYPIVIKESRINRKKLRHELEKKGIETRPLFNNVPDQPAYSFLSKKYEGKLNNSSFLGKNAFYIGCHQYLEEKDLAYMVKQFKELLK